MTTDLAETKEAKRCVETYIIGNPPYIRVSKTTPGSGNSLSGRARVVERLPECGAKAFPMLGLVQTVAGTIYATELEFLSHMCRGRMRKIIVREGDSFVL